MNFKIGNKEIGKNTKPYFIADIAANHDGDLGRAYRLIELAKEAGADAAKFQNFKAPTIVSKKGFENMGGQLSHQSSWKKSVFDVYADASIPDDWSRLLKEKCDAADIEYMTSPYDFDSVDHANHYVNCFKVGSGDITWIEIIEYIAKKGKPVLLATGASDIEDVKRAYEAVKAINGQIVLFQCNTNYTASEENFKYINLNVLKQYADLFPDAVLGLSDHTHGHATVLGAVTLGARVIEKHFTDDNDREGPDHKFSMTPATWKEMVTEANRLFMALGDGVKKIEENEADTAKVQRRALYFNKDLKKGHVLTKEDLFPLRPINPGELPPYCIDELVGKVLNSDILKDTPVKEESFQ